MSNHLIPVEERLGFLITRTGWAIRGHMNGKLHSLGVDLTPEQWMALNWLFHHPQACQQDLATAMHKTKAAITRILDGLAVKGLVARGLDPQDGRKSLISLSIEAQALMLAILPAMLAEYNQLLEGLTPLEVQSAQRLLNHIYNRILQGSHEDQNPAHP